MAPWEMLDTLFGVGSILRLAFVRIRKMGTDAVNRSIKNISADELHVDVEQTSIDQMNNISILSRSDERNRAEKVVLSENDETQHSTCAINNKEDSLSKISHPLPLGSPVGQLRRKLLVLDLNGLLADIVSPPPKDCKADINIARHAVFKRPFCSDFLRFCFEGFEVGVWSSRNKKNVERVVDFLMGDMKHKLLFCWDLSYCTATRFKTLENKHKTLVFKELRRIWERNDPNIPWRRGDYDESNTVLLDDSPYKALLNPPNTAIFPCSYKFQDESDNSLGAGGDLRVYLEGLAEAENVQKFVEQHPFGQSAITERSESWDFYLRATNNTLLAPPTTI